MARQTNGQWCIPYIEHVPYFLGIKMTISHTKVISKLHMLWTYHKVNLRIRKNKLKTDPREGMPSLHPPLKLRKNIFFLA